jgi:SAM-dependent methyltransferase
MPESRGNRRRAGSVPVNEDSYYRDHWLEVEPERVAAYEVDLNALFLERAREHAEREGLLERIELHRIERDGVPLDDDSVDRVICKNVLEYVDDVAETVADFRRVLRPGGLVHAIDSDWGMLAVEPIGPERIAELFAAASVAYRTPLIGRQLYGFLRATGFSDVQVAIRAAADTQGLFSPVVLNMAGYARASGRIAPARVDALVEDVRRAIDDGTYLMVLPQFLVTGTA